MRFFGAACLYLVLPSFYGEVSWFRHLTKELQPILLGFTGFFTEFRVVLEVFRSFFFEKSMVVPSFTGFHGVVRARYVRCRTGTVAAGTGDWTTAVASSAATT